MRAYLRELERGNDPAVREAIKDMALVVQNLEAERDSLKQEISGLREMFEEQRDSLKQENEQLRRDLEEATAPPPRGKKGK